MSALLYQLTVTDRKGKALIEEVHTSPIILAERMLEIKKIAENKLEELAREQLEASSGTSGKEQA